jgi:hypothetical protein
MRPEMELGVTGEKSESEPAPPSDESSYGSGIQKGVVSPPFPFFVFRFSSPLCRLFLLFNATAYIRSPFLSLHSSSPFLEMIMVSKPVHLLSTPTTYHRRHPSAPPTVQVQPTRIPGLLSLSKPPSITPPRPQQPHHQTHHNRNPRPAYNNKPKPASTARQSLPPPTAAQPPLSEDSNNPVLVAHLPIKPQPLPATSSPSQDKSPRGRQSSKQNKDKSKPR